MITTTNNGSYPWADSEAGADLRRAVEQGLADDAVRALKDRVTRQVIDEQLAAGIDLPSDGLVLQDDPLRPLAALSGIRRGEIRDRFPGTRRSYASATAVAELSFSSPASVEDFLFAAGDGKVPVKVVMTGPFSIGKVVEDETYGDPMALTMALAIAMNQELRALQAAGATFIQVNEPALALHPGECPVFTRIWEVLGRGVSATLALHLPARDLTELYPALKRLKRLGCLSLDATPGMAGLELLAADPPPEPTRLSLGLVDGGSAGVESAADIVERLRPLIAGLPPERVLIGTASDLGSLPRTTAAAKLRSLVEAARSLARG